MRIGIASDIHLEFPDHSFPPDEELPEVDAWIFAGDIYTGATGIHWAAMRFEDVPVFILAGNHEFYHQDYDQTIAACFKAAESYDNVFFMENARAEVDGITFLGATLWTDYELCKDISAGMAAYDRKLNDRLITRNGRMWNAEDALEIHQKSLAWFDHELSKEREGPVVCISHHGISPQSTHPKYRPSPFSPEAMRGEWDQLNASFNSDLESLVKRHSPDVWVHGHVHDGFDYMINDTRVVVNPKGYRGENPDWEARVIEV